MRVGRPPHHSFAPEQVWETPCGRLGRTVVAVRLATVETTLDHDLPLGKVAVFHTRASEPNRVRAATVKCFRAWVKRTGARTPCH